MMKRMIRIAVLIALTVAGCHATEIPSERDDHAQAEQLPAVLLIGDSISQGYRGTVVEELKGIASVSRIPGNGEWTGTGVSKIDEWLGDTNWDVIHFNWGLWDMYGWPYYDEDRSPEAYERRLDQLVIRLKKTNATLIWATTTPPCPEDEVSMRDRFKKPGVISPLVERAYLDAAERVMRRHGIRINDLNKLVRADLDNLQLGPDNVHFNEAGCRLLGKQVATAIQEALNDRTEQLRQ